MLWSLHAGGQAVIREAAGQVGQRGVKKLSLVSTRKGKNKGKYIRFEDADRRDALKMQDYRRENTINGNLTIQIKDNIRFILLCCAKVNVIIKATYDKSHFQIKQARAKIIILSDRV